MGKSKNTNLDNSTVIDHSIEKGKEFGKKFKYRRTVMKNNKVAIIGYALDKYAGETNLSSEEMGFRVAKMAREHAGVNRDDITSIHGSTMDFFDGVTISNGLIIPAAGGYNRDSTRIQNGCVFAIISACASILSGASDMAVVCSADSVNYDIFKVSNASTDVFFNQPIGLNHISTYALFSNAYMNKYKIEEEDIATVAAKNYKDGVSNPHAHIRSGYSIDEVLKSTMIATPLRQYDLAMTSSCGGGAIFLTSAERAKKYPRKPIFVSGIGVGTSSVNLDEVVDLPALRYASDKAFKTAGINNPVKDLNVIELNNPFSAFELAAYEALGLCKQGKTVEFLEKGITRNDGDLPVNPSGGTLCTNAPNSGGLFRTIMAIKTLEKAGGGGKVKRALVHDSDMSIGLTGDSHAVMVLEREV